MKNTVKKTVLNSVASLGRKIAVDAECWPSWACIYQPETPEALKKLRKKK